MTKLGRPAGSPQVSRYGGEPSLLPFKTMSKGEPKDLTEVRGERT